MVIGFEDEMVTCTIKPTNSADYFSYCAIEANAVITALLDAVNNFLQLPNLCKKAKTLESVPLGGPGYSDEPRPTRKVGATGLRPFRGRAANLLLP